MDDREIDNIWMACPSFTHWLVYKVELGCSLVEEWWPSMCDPPAFYTHSTKNINSSIEIQFNWTIVNIGLKISTQRKLFISVTERKIGQK